MCGSAVTHTRCPEPASSSATAAASASGSSAWWGIERDATAARTGGDRSARLATTARRRRIGTGQLWPAASPPQTQRPPAAVQRAAEEHAATADRETGDEVVRRVAAHVKLPANEGQQLDTDENAHDHAPMILLQTTEHQSAGQQWWTDRHPPPNSPL